MSIRSALRALVAQESDLTRLELRSGLENPSVPLNSPAAFNLVFGGEPTASGEAVSERNGLEISTVYACVRLIAETAGSLPFRIWQNSGNTRTEARDHSLHYLLSVQPNPEMSAVTFVETLVGCMAFTGNAYVEIERGSDNSPVAFWPLHPLLTTPVRDEKTGELFFTTSDGMPNGEARVLKAADVIHAPLFSLDGLKGLSPVALHRQSLGLAQATLKAGARFFGNGSRPGGLLTPKSGPLKPEQAQAMREAWEKQASGVNQGRIAVLPSEWSYIQLGLSLEDSQFLASRGYSRNEICAIWRVDPHWCGDTTRQSNSNHEQASLSLLQDTIAPYLRKLTLEFQRKLLPPTGRVQSIYSFEFDLTERLRTDLKTTLDAIALGRQNGVLTANEGRRQLGLNPVGPEGDVLWSPVNMIASTKFADWSPQSKPAPKDDTKSE